MIHRLSVLLKEKDAKLIKAKSKWVFPSIDHPTDQLKIRLMLDEKIKGKRIIGLEARIDPGKVHQLHIHENEYVIVYSIEGKCKVTVGSKTKIVHPKTMIFIPPKVPHRFENAFSKKWEGIAFAIGSGSKIKNTWLE